MQRVVSSYGQCQLTSTYRTRTCRFYDKGRETFPRLTQRLLKSKNVVPRKMSDSKSIAPCKNYIFKQ